MWLAGGVCLVHSKGGREIKGYAFSSWLGTGTPLTAVLLLVDCKCCRGLGVYGAGKGCRKLNPFAILSFNRSTRMLLTQLIPVHVAMPQRCSSGNSRSLPPVRPGKFPSQEFPVQEFPFPGNSRVTGTSRVSGISQEFSAGQLESPKTLC